MPIKINLLAEAQAAEEQRRKDPVKRGILAGIVLVAGALIFSSTIQLKVMRAKSQLNGLEASWKSIEKSYEATVDVRRRAVEAEGKIVALQQMATNRFLWGNALNAFQQTLNGIEDVQVLHVRADQTYSVVDEVKPKDGKPGIKGSATERINLLIDAIDSSSQLANHSRYKASIANEPFFQNHLHKTNGVLLLSLSAPQADGAKRNPFVKFSLQCSFAEKVR
jgi:hypothetical protein